jgi:molecular chaperone HscB
MPADSYFTLLALSPSFDIDPKVLESAYFAQQRLYHPDRFIKKTPQDRQAALLRSVDINAAYETLKKPLLRAQYLLHLQGIEVGTDSDTVKPSMQLLMETMQWREAIDEAQTPDAVRQLDNLLNELNIKTTGLIAAAYRAADWVAMAQETLRLGYVTKTQDALRLRLSKV